MSKLQTQQERPGKAPARGMAGATAPIRDAGMRDATTRRAGKRAFTLIELLVVISIIGVLASMVVGLAGLAGRKSKEGRVRVEMNKLINSIENYKSALGFYPPDHRVTVASPGGAVPVGVPSPNQLYYELSGVVYQNNQFYVVGQQEPITAAVIQQAFGAATSGFANAARDPKDLKITEEFKSSQYKRLINPPVDVLIVPVKGPANVAIPVTGGVTVNPWLYVSTSPTNNPGRFDLWTEVIVGGKTVRFSNWEKDPVVLSP